MNPFLKVPTRYWFISCMGVLWFAMGALDYVMISYKIPAYMQAMPEDLRYWFDRRPVWFTGVWAISVWSALLGSFLLLLRRRQALRLFVLALVGFIIAALWAYLSEAANMAHMQSTITHIFNGLILFSLVYFSAGDTFRRVFCVRRSGAIARHWSDSYSTLRVGTALVCGVRMLIAH
ncbi:hypothetical protein N9N45_00055 [Planktomarina temperata]|nr:hypothetical protein [Planktomarina temperata]